MLSDGTGVDFMHYKHSTLRRRLQRRMVLRRLQSMDDYLRRLRDEPAELQRLFEEVLIPVTSFFREPESYEALATTVLPRLMADRPPKAPLRIWVAGCASGEEVYSIAICALEFLSDMAEAVPVRIFGTDISERSIEARRGPACTAKPS